MLEHMEGVELVIACWPVMTALLVGLICNVQVASIGTGAWLGATLYGIGLSSYLLLSLARARGGVLFRMGSPVASTSMRCCVGATCFLMGYVIVSWAALI